VIAYINSDDYYLPGAFDAALPLFADPAVRWVAGATEYREVDGTLHASLEPVLPTGSKASWVRSTWYVPQASSFWRRDVFDEFGLLREDLHFVFDTEFGLRLALAGLRPRPVEQALAVRYLQPQAKSADRTQFDKEYKQVAKQLRRRLTRAERAQDRLVRGLYAVLRAQYLVRKRFGLLHLRERWFGGRFARS
jgi:GT2 family glycosyltransferase